MTEGTNERPTNIPSESRTNRGSVFRGKTSWWLTEVFGPLTIICSVIALFPELAMGHFPVSHDHPAHMFNAWLTADKLLPSGDMRGWTDLWFAGYPANELYGPGGNLWVSAIRWLTFQQLSFGATYGLSLLLLLLMLPLSTYALGRAWFGPIAGTFAGLLLAFTRGSWYDLGWFWILEMGVWPFALGAAITLLSMIAFRRYLRRGGPRGLAVAATSFALAIVGHPMSLLLLGFAGPVIMAFVVLEQKGERVFAVTRRAAGAALLGTSLCAAWLVPFIAKSAYTQKLGEIWFELHEVLSELLQLDLYGAEWRLVLALSIVGVFVAIIRRQVWVLCLTVISLLMLLFSTTTIQYHLRLFDVLGNLASIQYPRFVGVVRIFMYLIAGYAVSVGWAGIRQRWDLTSRAGRYKNPVAIALLVLAIPLCAPIPKYLGHNHMPDDETLVTENELGWWEDYLSAAEWIRDKPGRIAAFQDPSEHVFATLPIFTGQSVYTGGFVPAHTYRFFFEDQRNTSWLPTLGVKWVLSLGPWRSAPGTSELRKSFGRIRIYELAGNVRPPISIRDGDCKAHSVHFSESQVVVSVTDVKSPCRVVIHRSDFPNWHAAFNGREVAIERASVVPQTSYSPFMSVWASKAGTLDIRWKPVTSDTVGKWVAVFGWIWLLALAVFSIRRQWWLDLKSRAAMLLVHQKNRLEWAARIALVLTVVFGLSAAVQRSQETHYTLDRHLDEAESGILVKGEVDACRPSRAGRGWNCGEKWDLIRSGLFSYIYDSRYCIYAHPSPRGPKVIRFKDVPLRSRLSGFFGLLDSSQGRGDVHFSVAVGDNPPIRYRASKIGELKGFELVTREGTDDVEFQIEADKPAWRHFCFNAQVID